MRVIQDSEDEDDLAIDDAGVAVPERDAPQHHMSNNATPQPGEKGTGSTESLKRAIKAAHRAQFQDASSDRQNPSLLSEMHSAANPSAQNISQDAPKSSVSLPGHASKRRRTSLDGAVALPSSRDIFPVTDIKRHSGETHDNANPRLGTTPDKTWDLQGTMRDDWEHHEPMALFPQTVSSTVPNATATQQQLLDEVLAPGFLGIGPGSYEAANYEPAKSSVPWSEYLKSSSKDSRDPAQSADQPARLTQSNAHDSALNPDEKILGDEGRSETNVPADEPLSPFVVEQNTNSEVNGGSNDLGNGLDTTTVSRSSRTQQKSSTVPNSEDDLLAIGIPPEQYKPRPSRSRSLKLSMEGPIDYSQRPERAAKKTRRTRTSGDADTTSTATTPEKIRQICDMGFTPLTTKKALKQHNGDVTHTVDWLIANAAAERDELAPPDSPNPRHKNNQSKRNEGVQECLTTADHSDPAGLVSEAPDVLVGATATVNSDDAPQPAPTVPVTRSPTLVKVVIPRATRTPSKQEKQQLATSVPSPHDSEDTSAKTDSKEVSDRPATELEDQALTTDQPLKGKKRGRGRPKKEAKPVAVAEEKLTENETRKPGDLVPEGPHGDNTHEPDEPATTEATGTSNEHQTGNAESVGRDPTVTHTTPEPPPEKKVKQLNDTPSSITKSKTPYRVGLSKRARIAPLLRTLKK